MSNYTVQKRDTGEIVYAYTADEAVDWPEYPFAEFNHIPQPAAGPVPVQLRRVTKLEFVGRLGDDLLATTLGHGSATPRCYRRKRRHG